MAVAWPDDISVLRNDLERVKEPRKMSYPWFALQVRSRYENIVTAHLSGMGYESFLPLYMCRRRWSDRFKEIELPLFPGCLFCQFNPLNRLPILSIPGVVHVVGVGRTPSPLTKAKLPPFRPLSSPGCPANLGRF